MHNESFRLLGLDYVYLCFDVPETDLKTAVDGLKILGVRGFNCTMPDKTRMCELADHLSPAAKMIGAVNTVVNDDGILTGHNTDGVGYIQALKEAGVDIQGKTITLLGAGGASSAIAVQAALDGAAKSTFSTAEAVPGSMAFSWQTAFVPAPAARLPFMIWKILRN